MKKIISLLAVCALLATTLFALSAQATPYTEYPYIYEDLENGTPANFGLLSNSTGAVHGMKADPTGRSGYVYGVSIAPKAANYSFVEAVKIQDIPVVMGSTMKSSLMVYMATGTPRTNNVSVVYSLTGTTLTADGEKSDQTFNGWYEQPATINWTPGTWQKIESKVTWSKDLAYGVSGSTPLNGNTIDYDSIKIYRVLFRIGANNNSAFIVDESKLLNDASTLDFYFDEMTYEPYADTSAPVIPADYNKLTFSTFDNPYANGHGFNAGYAMSTDAGTARALFTSKSDSPAYEGAGSYLNIANPDGLYAFNQFMINQQNHANILWSANHMYELSFWFRANEMFTQTNTTATSGHLGIKLQMTSGTLNTTDVNGLTGLEDWASIPHTNVLPIDQQWHKVTVNFQFELKTFAEFYRNGVPMQIGLIPYVNPSNRWDTVHMDIDIDDLVIRDLGPLTNGDFETGAGKSVRVRSSGGTPSISAENHNLFGWNTGGNAIEHSSDVRANADSGSTKSAKVTITTASANISQGLALEKDIPRYKMSFWAKADVADGESKPFALVLDRSATTTEQAQEYYDTPNYEFYTGKYEVLKTDSWSYGNVLPTQTWRLTNEWQYFETYISNEFGVIPGHEAVSTQFIKPRQPMMYFVVDGGNPAGVTYYLDDVKLEGAPKEMPEASGFKVNGVAAPGEKLTVSYDFADPAGHEEGASIVRVYDEDGASFGSFKARGGSYTVPEQAIGKKLTFVLSPVDAEGNAGAKVSAMAETTEDWVKMFVGADFKSARLYAGKAMSGKILFASYNGKELISVDDVDVTVTEAGTLVPVSATQDFDLTDATYVKVFFWNGLTDVVPLTTAVKADIK